MTEVSEVGFLFIRSGIFENDQIEFNLKTCIKELKKMDNNNIQDCDIYVTIDKDVLTEKDLLTDFDGGSLTVKDMFTMLSVLIQKFRKRIVSADICGDPRHIEDYKETKLKDIRLKHLLFNQGMIKLFKNYIG